MFVRAVFPCGPKFFRCLFEMLSVPAAAELVMLLIMFWVWSVVKGV